MIDDDVALTRPWGFDVEAIATPVLLVHGCEDRMVPPSHSEWLFRQCGGSELWLRRGDGHVSVFEAASLAMDWLALHG